MAPNNKNSEYLCHLLCSLFVIIFYSIGNSQNTVSIQGKIILPQPTILSDTNKFKAILLDKTDMITYTKALSPQGQFYFNASKGHDYELKISQDSSTFDYMNGCSTLDMVMIQRHILSIVSLSPISVIAADTNGDQKVTVSDLILLRNLIIGFTARLPVKPWRFFNRQLSSESIQLTQLQSDSTENDFIPIKVGDINGNVFW
jgi:hypothetical protein